ncbi:MAG: hypothetical protein U9N61_03705, partial [Euryarchaeota archaeon]|nr:hypothetical protein [Euryarchaeota archaeon]
CSRKLQNLQGYVIIVIGGLDDQSLCDRIPGGSEVLCGKGIGRDKKDNRLHSPFRTSDTAKCCDCWGFWGWQNSLLHFVDNFINIVPQYGMTWAKIPI